ncbi:MAG: hypothetical protein KDH15_12165 [Rhodocyclaceae bacterium]|nr:hypothetical protein [Rhodocyclaceae bacterium]
MHITVLNEPIDAQKATAADYVEFLHKLARDLNDPVIADAAACLDGYRAGLTLATPHPHTGYTLVRTGAGATVDTAQPPDEIDVGVSRLWEGFCEAGSDLGHLAIGTSMLAALHGLAVQVCVGRSYYAIRLDGDDYLQTWRIKVIRS